ncbi:MAG TPA: N-acetylmannosamine-6-phosphate 2-epimerase, partial [Paenibacillus sp.]|nr:N-acetylmannosamine-6-phosphate 2-epimerase [Paenibacillus sp.]
RIPVVGLYKVEYADSDVWITPTQREARLIAEAGADALAIDATGRGRPGGERFESIVDAVRAEFPRLLIFADVSTREEGEAAMRAGADFVSTAIAGYTPYSVGDEEPAYELIRELSALGRAPVIAEGRVWTREQARLCLDAGAYAVVVGTAITRPREITKRFVRALEEKVDP